MSIRLHFERIGGVYLNKLETEIRAIVAIDGVAYNSKLNTVGVDFVLQPDNALRAQVQNIITAHDLVAYEEQLRAEEQSRIADYSALAAMAEAGLTQIANDRAALAADVTALAAAATLVAVKPIVSDMLTRLDNLNVRQDKIIRVLRHVVKGT